MIKEKILKWAQSRNPDFVIGGLDAPYMRRHWLIPRNRFFNIYVHEFLRSDDDRAIHDHPWSNCSILLEGEYTEHTKTGARILKAGDWRMRWSGKFAHRVELHNGPCWTVFITGPRYREWGFLCPDRWVRWVEFTDSRDKGTIGKGCDQ